MSRNILVGGVVIVIATFIGAIAARSVKEARGYRSSVIARHQLATDRPIEVQEDGYVTSRTCRACHPTDYHSWHASYHRTMTQVATPDIILAPFDKDITIRGKTYRIAEYDGEVWVHIHDPSKADNVSADPDEKLSTGERIWPLVLTTGSHHYQAYWVPTGHSRKLEMLPFSYNIADDRVYHPKAFFICPPRKSV